VFGRKIVIIHIYLGSKSFAFFPCFFPFFRGYKPCQQFLFATWLARGLDWGPQHLASALTPASSPETCVLQTEDSLLLQTYDLLAKAERPLLQTARLLSRAFVLTNSLPADLHFYLILN
jgi:hypothetical protein